MMPWVTAVIQDITEARQIEDLIRRAERLQAVAELGASLAHEIKNPLASIRSAVEQLAGDRLAGRTGRRCAAWSSGVGAAEPAADGVHGVQPRGDARAGRASTWRRVARDAIELVTRHPDRAEDTRIDFCRPADRCVVDGDRTCCTAPSSTWC
jgi:signal transduction histidine kinase